LKRSGIRSAGGLDAVSISQRSMKLRRRHGSLPDQQPGLYAHYNASTDP
jgi:hypothetical protein